MDVTTDSRPMSPHPIAVIIVMMTLDESAYWIYLEYRVCDELSGLRDPAARRYWCDGFEPSWYILDGQPPRILGCVWMGVGPRHQEQWQFTLLLGRSADSPESIDWSALLPPPDVTRWLTLDPTRKQLVIEPGAAVPDAAYSRRGGWPST
jgi:hypothetical protein